jgi:hypothetical protein
MRILLLLALASCSTLALAQDDESLPDIRNKRENFVKYPKGEIRDDLATFTLGGVDERLGKAPLQKLPATDYTSNSITWEGENYKVVITSERFEPSKHKLQYYYEKHLVKIDNKPYYGNYGKVPTMGIRSVVVVHGKDTIPVPADYYKDLYQPEFIYHDESGQARTRNAVYISADKKKLYIYMLNNEAVGHYEVTWIINDRHYVGRVIDSGLLK